MIFVAERKGELMGLINREALLAEYDRVHVGEPGKARKLIENAPPIELRCEDCEAFNKTRLLIPQPERKNGKWIKLDMHAHLADHKCTACGQECYVPTCMGEPMYTYCPNCGADMREEQDG